jgi:hypothetical protein
MTRRISELHFCALCDDAQEIAVGVELPSALACYWPQWVSARGSDPNTFSMHVASICALADKTPAYRRSPTSRA